ncbi:zinc-ribbon domain-containing protein [Profundibacterium mesophilum]|uniref:Zinc finger/thioredoxin putative domain-containing protein n=1 Tax=Profundibacterium mesophilum KAUST100406-0324 TaxID=1037889 RepID=A0A921NX99_9RHOB|nr:zinc-ribbon domain-containing protein [Profundibacterium mesophilum]KAF0676434.1 Uncharacterized protein PMES_01166 [Profundibacterium mesophilum KAUST100406-0324]
MRLICPNCTAQYEVDSAMIPDEGRDVQCSHCAHTWFQPGPNMPLGDDAPWDEDDAFGGAQDGADVAGPARRTAPLRREMDEETRRILREEAEREAEARRRAAEGAVPREDGAPEDGARGARGEAPWPDETETDAGEHGAGPVEPWGVETRPDMGPETGPEMGTEPHASPDHARPGAEPVTDLEPETGTGTGPDRDTDHDPEHGTGHDTGHDTGWDDETDIGTGGRRAAGMPAPPNLGGATEAPRVAHIPPEREFDDEKGNDAAGGMSGTGRAPRGEEDPDPTPRPDTDGTPPRRADMPEGAAGNDFAQDGPGMAPPLRADPRAEAPPEGEAPKRGAAVFPAAPPIDPVAAGSRRDLLPDIEEINSTLAAAPQRNLPPPGTAQTRDESPRGFRLGFSLMLFLAAALILLYVFAPPLARALPAIEPVLAAYVDQVNVFRLTLDGWLEDAAAGLSAQEG